MLHAGERHATRLGRALRHANGVWQAGFGPHGTGSAPVEFARHHGWALGLPDVRSTLFLPADAERLDALLAERAERRRGYAIRAWSGTVPDELLSGWAHLEATLTRDALRGELVSRTEKPSAEAVRDDERILARTGQTKLQAAAFSPDGELVAYSAMIVHGSGPRPAFQWGTIVRAEHRGRGLGAAVKVAALRLLERERPDVRTIITENAQANGPMIALNEALGFGPVLYAGLFQKHAP